MYTLSDFPKPNYISVNGITLEVFEAGQNNKNPIVLCHGWPEHAFSWRYQIPALVESGYHVIVPNQRGYGNSSRPSEVSHYDIEHLAGDLVSLLDHYGYEKATFIGHDWGASVVWWLSLLHPNRVDKIINLSLPYQERGDKPWLELMEEFLGSDYYFVHFNQKPGVADTILDANTSQFLQNLFRKSIPITPPQPGMMMINLAQSKVAAGEPLMSDQEMSVFISSFEKSGFTGSINWYRNLDRNWHLLKDVDPVIQQPALMIYGELDQIPKGDRLSEFVPNVTEASLKCGHWIQQEMPEQTNQIILNWLEEQDGI
ncbi:MAG: alpha/beta hydrolase [Candidatus Cloacimonetes bacterium]|nr:alpha/beta hydrolase [Candidatus Cloacimonadota bacterium]